MIRGNIPSSADYHVNLVLVALAIDETSGRDLAEFLEICRYFIQSKRLQKPVPRLVLMSRGTTEFNVWVNYSL